MKKLKFKEVDHKYWVCDDSQFVISGRNSLYLPKNLRGTGFDLLIEYSYEKYKFVDHFKTRRQAEKKANELHNKKGFSYAGFKEKKSSRAYKEYKKWSSQ